MTKPNTTYTQRSAFSVAASMALLLLLAATTTRTADAVKNVPRKLRQQTDNESGLHEVDHDEHEQHERQLKGGGFEVDVDGLVETGDCAPFEGVQGQREFMNTESECLTQGGCSDGCCRVYNWLVCDTSNSQWRLQCVCNDNTRPRGSYTGTTVTQGGLTSPWEGPGSPLPEALSSVGAAAGGGGGGNGPISSAQAAPGGGQAGKKGKSKSSKSKDVGSTSSAVSSSFTRPGESPYVSPNGAQVGSVIVNPAPGASPPGPAPANTVTPPAPAPGPAPGTSSNNGASVAGVTVQSANENPGSGTSTTSQSNSNAAAAAAGTPPAPQVAADACADGSMYWDMPAFENQYTQCTGTDNECDVGIGECCLAQFCLCGKPGQGAIPNKCVPPYDYNTLFNNQL